MIEAAISKSTVQDVPAGDGPPDATAEAPPSCTVALEDGVATIRCSAEVLKQLIEAASSGELVFKLEAEPAEAHAAPAE